MSRTTALPLLATLLLAVCGAVAGALWWGWTQPAVRAAERLTELEALGPLKKADAGTACLAYERERLRQGDLRVDCAKADLEQKGPKVYEMRGAVRTRGPDNYWFGGGFRTPVCMGLGPDGWTWMGDSFDLEDCAISMVGGEEEAVQVREARATELIGRVRQALEQEASVPESCDLSPQRAFLTLVDREVLEGRAERTRYGSGLVAACLGEAQPWQRCELRTLPAHVLVIEERERQDPTLTGASEYTPGWIAGRLVLIDVQNSAVVCAREHQVRLDDDVVFDDLATAWRERQKAALVEGVAALGGGALRLDPYYGD